MMRQSSFMLVVAGSLLACGGAPAKSPPVETTASTPAAGALDGRSYEVMLDIPGQAPQKDTIRFANGRFESTACTALGFPKWSDYEAHPDGKNVTFRGVAKHPSGTTMNWTGTIERNSLEGTATRTMNGKTDVMKVSGAAPTR